jgi:hypothetical protein
MSCPVFFIVQHHESMIGGGGLPQSSERWLASSTVTFTALNTPSPPSSTTNTSMFSANTEPAQR